MVFQAEDTKTKTFIPAKNWKKYKKVQSMRGSTLEKAQKVGNQESAHAISYREVWSFSYSKWEALLKRCEEHIIIKLCSCQTHTEGGKTLLEAMNAYGVDCGEGFTGAYLFPNSSSCVHKYVVFCTSIIPQ